MSKIINGQSFIGSLADILNKEFKARNVQGQPLAGWYRSAWPSSAPFLVDQNDRKRGGAVVWFPIVAKDPTAKVKGDWLNVVSEDRSVITTRYVGDKPIHEINVRVSPFIGKMHIVFARWLNKGESKEFFGVYTSDREGNTLVYRRIADIIETRDWLR